MSGTAQERPFGPGPNLVLCGFMACGKTTLAALLAARTGLACFDTDTWIEARAGRSIAGIFEALGEPWFRAQERSAVAHAAARRGRVIATGGGVPLDPDNVWRLGTTGVLFYLEVDPGELFRRLTRPALSPPSPSGGRQGCGSLGLAGGCTRPLAVGFTSVADVARKLEQRRPHYEALPNRVVCGSRSAPDLADEVLRRYRQLTAGGR